MSHAPARSSPPRLMVRGTPRLDRWVRFDADGTARIAFGKTENGQGVMTALAQIAAGELDLSFAQVRVAEPTTNDAPDDGLTAGSLTVELTGVAMRKVCAEVRARFVAAAARKLGCAVAEIEVREGAFWKARAPSGETYWTLCDAVDLDCDATGAAPLKDPATLTVVGESQARVDLPAKLFGAAFLHDLTLPGMLHARVLRQPGAGARLVRLDTAAVRAKAGADVDVLIDGAFVALIAPREAQAVRAHAVAEALAQWDGASEVGAELSEPDSLQNLPSETFTTGDPPPEDSNRRRHAATYGRPYISHAPMGPSVGVAEMRDGKLTVWTHNQGAHFLRDLIRRVTGLEAEAIEVRHEQGPGCYGHNGSDDAAVDAAVIALRRPGSPVRVQWRREDEFAWSPVGTAMQVRLSAELDASGRLVDFTNEMWSGTHVARGVALAEAALPRPEEPKPVLDAAAGERRPESPKGARFSGAVFNAIPSYDIASSRIVEHATHTPVRTSSLRGLGGPPNTFFTEAFIDELAELAGADPLAWRLGMVSNPRGRAALERIGAMCGWERRGDAGSGRGLGIGYDRHRGAGAFCACAAEVEVEESVKLVRLWCAVDAGLIVNPDGARNQLEGGMIMAASWLLKEQVRLGGAGIASTTWEDYPILRFDEVPPVEIALLNVRDPEPYGLGEISQGPVMGAIANAVAHALGMRVREAPFTREKIAATMLQD